MGIGVDYRWDSGGVRPTPLWYLGNADQEAVWEAEHIRSLNSSITVTAVLKSVQICSIGHQADFVLGTQELNNG